MALDNNYFVDVVSHRVEQLLNERKVLIHELSRHYDGTVEHEKSFVRAYQDNLLNHAICSDKINRLEHLLAVI